MPDKNQLPFLVNLIDDDTTEVRTEVLKELSNYGMSLEEDLLEYTDALTDEMLEIIQPALNINRRRWLKENWNLWFDYENDFDKLECALELIAKFQYGITTEKSGLSMLLSELAEEFTDKYPYGNELDLANFLFRKKGLSGDKKNYYNPLNSNLLYVIKSKKGLPISLVIVYMLIGNRIGFRIEGCNFPGHFLAKTYIDDELVLIDCFNGGRILYENDIDERVNEDSVDAIKKLIHLRTGSKSIIRRVLNNLVTAYKNKEEEDTSKFFEEILSITPW